MLKIKNELPQDFFDYKVEELHQKLGGPTLFHLEGGSGAPVFISVLLHGNEHSGFLAMQKVLSNYHHLKKKLERPLLFFIANTEAAALNKRMVKGDVDFNRIWDSSHPLSSDVLTYVIDQKPLCCIDIHNNTGNNPFYSCVNVLDDNALHLARFFSETMVYFTEPHEVLSLAFSKHMPSITIEAGKSREIEGINTLVKKIESLFKHNIFSGELNRSKLTLLHTVGRMSFDPQVTLDFSFQKGESQFSFLNRVDEFNFQVLESGTILAKANSLDGFIVERSDNKDSLHHFFEVSNGELKVAHSFIPAMITKNIENIHSDCFGYIMEPYKI